MSYCINSLCQRRDNSVEAKFCQNCGTPLVIQDRYRILSLCPEYTYGFTEVFEISDSNDLSQQKVLKTLTDLSCFKSLELFEQERDLLASLAHTGIPKFEDYFSLILIAGQRREIHCLITEKVEGINLEDWLSRYQKIQDEAQAFDWLSQLASILEYIHQNEYFHSDIRPVNIILRPDGTLVLVNFSAADPRSESITDKCSTENPSFYGKPEHERSQPSPQFNLRALGQTFLQLLTGESPDTLDLQTWSSKTNLRESQLIELVDSLVQGTSECPKSANEVILAIEKYQQEAICKEQNRAKPLLPNRLKSQMDWSSGNQLQDGKYTIDRQLGSGGFGAAYLATERSGQQVVIKTLHSYLLRRPDGKKLRQDFINEAIKIANCQNRYIVKVHEIVTEEIALDPTHQILFPCIILEYIEGQTLQQHLNHQQVMSEVKAVGYIRQIGEALTVVHNQNLLHRDVKPDNIMIRASTDEAVLIDFGIARQFVPGQEISQTEFVTEGYAPVEQYYTVEKRGAFTDVYALAATLYTALTGQKPCKSLDREKAVALNSQDPLVSPQQLNPEISDWVNRAILKGMQIQAIDRSQTIQDWLSLLVPTSDELFRRAFIRQTNGNYQAAIQDYTEAIDMNQGWNTSSNASDSGSLPRAYHYRGNCRYHLSNWQEAWADYSQAIELKPDCASAYFDRGLALKETGATKQALKDFQTAAELYQRQGNTRDCQNAQNQIAALSPPSPPLTSKVLFGRALAKQEAKNYSGAIADYTQAIKINQDWGDPSNSDYYYGRATAFHNRGLCHQHRWRSYRTAIQDYTQAVQLKPDFALAYHNRAFAYAATGDKRAALEDYQTAAELYRRRGEEQRYQSVQKRIEALTSNSLGQFWNGFCNAWTSEAVPQPRTKNFMAGRVTGGVLSTGVYAYVFLCFAPPSLKNLMPSWFPWIPGTAPKPAQTLPAPSPSATPSLTLPSPKFSPTFDPFSLPPRTNEEVAAQQRLLSTQLPNIKFEKLESFSKLVKPNFDTGSIECFAFTLPSIWCRYTFDFEAASVLIVRTPAPAPSNELIASFYDSTGNKIFPDEKLFAEGDTADTPKTWEVGEKGRLQFSLPDDLSKVSVIRFSAK